MSRWRARLACLGSVSDAEAKVMKCDKGGCRPFSSLCSRRQLSYGWRDPQRHLGLLASPWRANSSLISSCKSHWNWYSCTASFHSVCAVRQWKCRSPLGSALVVHTWCRSLKMVDINWRKASQSDSTGVWPSSMEEAQSNASPVSSLITRAASAWSEA